MKILLINPPYTRLRGSGQAAFFPLGLGYLAGTLAAAGHEPLIYSAENCRPGEPLPQTGLRQVFENRSQGHKNFVAALANDDHPVWRETRQVLDQVKPDLVGITALSVQFGAAAKLAGIVKAWRPQTPVIFGGHHATYLPEDALQRVPAFDALVLGEGEATFLELSEAYAKGGQPDLSRIPGLAWRNGDAAAFSERRGLIENLDSLPAPRKDLVLFPEGFHPSHFASLILGRGCPWRCRFCSSQVFWQRRTRMRSAANCLEEMAALRQAHGINHFMFWDDAFTVSRKFILAFCQAVQGSGQRPTFDTATRVDLLDEEVIGALKAAGCVGLSLGVESGSPRVSAMIHKDINFDTLRRAVGLVKGAGLSLGTFFMAGFPRERVEDLQMTFDLIKEIQADQVAFNIFDPMPGSELYDECVQLGLVPEDADWRDFPLWPDAYYVSEMSHAEFDALAWEMARYLFKRNESLLGKLKRNLPLLKTNPSAFLGKVVKKLTGG